MPTAHGSLKSGASWTPETNETPVAHVSTAFRNGVGALRPEQLPVAWQYNGSIPAARQAINEQNRQAPGRWSS